jgi:hypothetical protein
MSRSGSDRCLFAFGFVASAAGASCGTNLPGTTLGTYKVTAELAANTCGAGLGAPDPWQFDVELSETASTAYWSWMDASPLLSGARSGPADATLIGYQIANVDATDATMGPCDLQRNDEVEIMLGAGTPPSSFQGTIRYGFSAQEGAACADQLSVSGGTYTALPCSVGYSMTGSRE